MNLLSNFLPKSDFNSYEDFKRNLCIDVPEGFNFARDVVDAYAQLEPNKLALLYCNDDGEEKRLTFADISLLSKQAAAYFMDMGITQGDRVILMLRRRWEYWVCAVAMHRLGAVVVPASIQFKSKDIIYRINTAKAKAILYIDDEFVKAQIDGIGDSCPTLQHRIIVGGSDATRTGSHAAAHDFSGEFMQCAPTDYIEDGDNASEALAYFTSGTTSMPKMALHNKTYPLGHILTARYMQRVQDDGLHLTQADSGWAKFGWGNIYGQWICGSAILAYDPLRFDSVKLMETMHKYQPTTLCIPPTMYRFLLRDGLQQKHVASINWYSTAGEPLSPEVNKEFRQLTGHSIHEGFGQSEGTPITCSYEWLEVRPGSMGKPSALYDVRIVDKKGEPCLPGDVGEVVIYADKDSRYSLGLTYGYIKGDIFVESHNGIYHTGDMAYEDEDGYFWFVGRNDDMIKCSGYRIGPFEIESILNTHDAVRDSAIVGRPDRVRGQVVCAVIALRDGYEPSEQLTKELQEYVKAQTAPYKYPRIVEYVAELPKTSSGKTIRRYLADASDKRTAV